MFLLLWSVSFSDSLLYNVPFIIFPLLYNKCILWLSYTYTHFHVFLLLYSYSPLYNHILWVNELQILTFLESLILISFCCIFICVLLLLYSKFFSCHSLFCCSVVFVISVLLNDVGIIIDSLMNSKNLKWISDSKPPLKVKSQL